MSQAVLCRGHIAVVKSGSNGGKIIGTQAAVPAQHGDLHKGDDHQLQQQYHVYVDQIGLLHHGKDSGKDQSRYSDVYQR